MINDPDRANSHFEFNQKGSHESFKHLAVKRYVRAAAGNVMGDPSDIRPPHVLWLTVRYLRDCIID
jgi:predicted RNA binding protein YcfA (HicA-like mRNA interferase family)